MGTILDKKAWAEEFLKTIGNANPDPSTIKFVEAWEILESGPGPVVGADHNPLNTTEPWPNSTNFNSVGVKNYATYQDGLNASAAVLNNGLYPSLYHALQTNDLANLGMSTGPMAPNIVSDLSVWSTGSRVPVNIGYAQHIASIAAEANLPSGGDIGQAQPNPSGPNPSDALTAVGNALATITAASTWIKVGLFLLAVVLILVGGWLVIRPELGGGAQGQEGAATE